LTDRRILDKGYGRSFADALPVKLEVFDGTEALLEEIGAWFGVSSSPETGAQN
jgi:hypothetical protein